MPAVHAGLRIEAITDRSRTAWTGGGPRPITTWSWYPTATPATPWTWSDWFAPAQVAQGTAPLPGPHPVVLLSHGTGGGAAQLGWLAEPLARAGFVAVAVDHHGNTATEPLVPEAFARWWDRPADLSRALDHVAARGDVELDLDRVGAAGFSIGGYTVAALLGAAVDAERYLMLATGAVAAPPTPEFPGLLDALVAKYRNDVEKLTAGIGDDHRDRRVRAGFLMAPAQGEMVTAASLAAIDAPVAVRWGDADDIISPVDSGQRYATTIPGADGRSVGADVGHYQFLSEATDVCRAAAPWLGQDPPGVDRAAVHKAVAEDAIAFFTANL